MTIDNSKVVVLKGMKHDMISFVTVATGHEGNDSDCQKCKIMLNM